MTNDDAKYKEQSAAIEKSLQDSVAFDETDDQGVLVPLPDSSTSHTDAPLFEATLSERSASFRDAFRNGVNRWDLNASNKMLAHGSARFGAIVVRSPTMEWYLGGGKVERRYDKNNDPKPYRFAGIETDPTGNTQLTGPVIVDSEPLPHYLRVMAYKQVVSPFQVSLLPQEKRLRTNMSMRYVVQSPGMDARVGVQLTDATPSSSESFSILGNVTRGAGPTVVEHTTFPIAGGITGGFIRTRDEFKVSERSEPSEPWAWFLEVYCKCSTMFMLLEAKCSIHAI